MLTYPIIIHQNIKKNDVLIIHTHTYIKAVTATSDRKKAELQQQVNDLLAVGSSRDESAVNEHAKQVKTLNEKLAASEAAVKEAKAQAIAQIKAFQEQLDAAKKAGSSTSAESSRVALELAAASASLQAAVETKEAVTAKLAKTTDALATATQDASDKDSALTKAVQALDLSEKTKKRLDEELLNTKKEATAKDEDFAKVTSLLE